MRHVRAYGIAALSTLAAVGIGVAAVAFAQTTVTPLPDAAPVQAAPLDASVLTELARLQGDAKAGATKAGACAACHGLDGNPTDPQYPRLAGMPERYTATQLALYKSGQRNTGMAAIMMPMAAPLSAQDMRDLGAHFFQQKAAAGIADDTAITAGPYAGMKYYEVGEKLFRGGDPARGLPACMACHGPAGAGNPGPAYPHVAGQQSAYAVRRLQEYRAGTTAESDRHSFDIMATVAKSLTDEEIQSLGSYLQGLHQRTDTASASVTARPAAATPGAAPTAAPAAPAAPAPAEAAPAPTQS
jgi:cytochrome c553